MEIQYLRYAIEVAKTKSISQAAYNLFVSQSNLSRDLKKLEDELQIKIFERTSKGVEVTNEGEKFLSHALAIVDEVEKINKLKNEQSQQLFSIAVPKANYITQSFIQFVDQLDKDQQMLINFKETSSIGSLDEIAYNHFNLGIVRYQLKYQDFMEAYFENKGLVSKPLTQFEYLVAFSADDPLAKKENLTVDDLKGYLELTHGDPYIPHFGNQNIEDQITSTTKKIKIYDSMGQLSMINRISHSFMIIYPLDPDTLNKYNLVQRHVDGVSDPCVDALVFKKDYHLSYLDYTFIQFVQMNLKN